MFNIAAVLVLLISFNQFAVASTVYKYKDANGNWIFSGQPPEKEVET